VTFQYVLPFGLHTISAVYTPDAASQYVLGSQSANLTQNVLAASAISISSNNTNPVFGSPVTFTLTVTPAPTGAAGTEVVNVLVNGQNPQAATPGAAGTWTYTTNGLAIGSEVVTATYSGDANLASSVSTAVTETVSTVSTMLKVTAPASAIAGIAVTLTATVSANAPATATPAGTVTFMSGATSLGSGTLENGTFTINPTLPASSTPYSIVVTYTPATIAGGAEFAPSSQTISLPVPFLTPTVTITLPANAPTVKTPVAFVLNVAGAGPTPTGTVILNDTTDGTSSAAAILVNGAATVTWPVAGFAGGGNYTLTANYVPGGDPNYNQAVSASYTQQVVPILTQTTLDVTPTSSANSQPVLVASVASLNPSFPNPISEGSVTFMRGTTQLGIVPVQNGFATLPGADLPATATSVSASYADGTPEAYGPSQTAASVPVQNSVADFTMNLSKTALTLSASQNANLTITLTALNGFNEQIALGCGALPVGVTCTFTLPGSSVPLTSMQPLTGSAPLVLDLNIDTNNPLSGGSTTTNNYGKDSRTVLAALWWPFSLCFGFVLWRFRKRNRLLATSLLLLLGCAATLMNGCGGLSQSSAKAGTYSIQVTASGFNSSNTSSNISHSQTVTLTIQ
jgi:hypothetical protein